MPADDGGVEGQATEEGEVEVEVAVMVREGVLAVAAVAALVALCRDDAAAAAAAERRRRQEHLHCGLRPDGQHLLLLQYLSLLLHCLWPAALDAERGSWNSRISRIPAIGS